MHCASRIVALVSRKERGASRKKKNGLLPLEKPMEILQTIIGNVGQFKLLPILHRQLFEFDLQQKSIIALKQTQICFLGSIWGLD